MARKKSKMVEPGSEDAFGLTDLDVMNLPEFLDVIEAAGATVDRFEYSWQYPISEQPKIRAAVQAWQKQREAEAADKARLDAIARRKADRAARLARRRR